MTKQREILLRSTTNTSYLDVVLAKFGNEYVTWIHNKEFDSYNHGNYFREDQQAQAIADYQNRVKAYNR